MEPYLTSHYAYLLINMEIKIKYGNLKQTYDACTKQCQISTGQKWNWNTIAIKTVTMEIMHPCSCIKHYNGKTVRVNTENIDKQGGENISE